MSWRRVRDAWDVLRGRVGVRRGWPTPTGCPVVRDPGMAGGQMAEQLWPGVPTVVRTKPKEKCPHGYYRSDWELCPICDDTTDAVRRADANRS